ncbi:MAG: hypothetical protein OXU72_05820 [Gammaproteobacteria bacterium]|nr:hypothetical protein [Gammaproteobacteria bacterium]
MKAPVMDDCPMMKVKPPMKVSAPAPDRRDNAEFRERVRMRRFPFGALSSSESLAYSWTMWPCAEREAPYANSLLRRFSMLETAEVC